MGNNTELRIIQLPKIIDERGNLSFLQEVNQIPFEIMRTHWIYDVPGGEIRGGHSYISNQEFIVALSGSFDVIVKTAYEEQIFSLNRSYYGLFVPAGLWRHMENFSTNSVALVVSSAEYDENDYIRDFDQYKTILKND